MGREGPGEPQRFPLEQVLLRGHLQVHLRQKVTPQAPPELRRSLWDIHPFWEKPWRGWKPRGASVTPQFSGTSFGKKKGDMGKCLLRD